MENASDNDLLKLHLEKLRGESPRAQNGLIAYTYNGGVRESGFYSPSMMNIGDYVQSVAARQFLPRVDVYVDRDRLAYYDGPPCNMIMNAFYAVWKGNEVFSGKIRPLMVSLHLSDPVNLSEKTKEYLKRNEPIGCRDYTTRDGLRRNGIQAYFSGCLTLTLGETWKHGNMETWKHGAEYNLFCQL